MAKVSLIIPCYNEIRFIERTLESVIGEADEIIISDNASTDGTSDICQTFASKYPEIKYIKQKENIGAIHNFIFCINQATGEYIRNMGAHDMISRNSTQNMLDIFKEKPGVAMVYPKNVIRFRPDYSFISFNNISDFGNELLSESAYIRMKNYIIKWSDDTMFYFMAPRNVFLKSLNYTVFYNFTDEITLSMYAASRGKAVADEKSIFYRLMPDRNITNIQEQLQDEARSGRAFGKKMNMHARFLGIFCGCYSLALETSKKTGAPDNFSDEILSILLQKYSLYVAGLNNMDNIPDIIPEKMPIARTVFLSILKKNKISPIHVSKRYNSLRFWTRNYLSIKKNIKRFLPQFVLNSYKNFFGQVFSILRRLQYHKDKYYLNSYSQCGEDMIINFLARAIGLEENWSWIDVGANHPMSISNTALFYKQGRHGINIEANPLLINKFYQERKRDINLNIAIAEKSGVMDFYIMQTATLSTLSKEQALEYESMGYKISKVISVQTMTLTDVVNKYCEGVFPSFLSLDAEGYDLTVLKTINWNKTFPKIICVENVSLSKRIENHFNSMQKNELTMYLKSKNYSIIAFTMINAIFVHNSCVEER
jgi:FkbM family methyltransferase